MKNKISLISLVMITVVSVDSIRNLPAAAKFGELLVTFYILAAIFFLIPTALVSAELAGAHDCEGGIYTWVRNAFGDKTGVLAIWLQWIENVIWYPTILSFAAGTFTYIINPELAQNPMYMAFAVNVIFWLLTFLNLKGIEVSALFSDFCSIAGLLLPMSLIIIFGLYWYLSGKPMAINFSLESLVPKFHDSETLVSIVAIMLSFSGIEIATVHAKDVDNPQSKFPKALAYASIIILLTLMIGSLAIAIVIPPTKINLITGIIEAFQIFFNSAGIGWLVPLIAITLGIGAAGSVSNWIIAPTKGLLFAALDGNLPEVFATKNIHESPSFLLILQAIIVSIISLIFLLMPNINQSYWILTVIATQLYMIMYILMFVSFVKLKIKNIGSSDSFNVPGGMIGSYIVSALGIIGCSVTLIISFMLPDLGYNLSQFNYTLLLLVGLVVSIIPPYFLHKKIS